MLDNLHPPPRQKKRIPEGENDAFWPCGFIIDFARGMGGGGGGGGALLLKDCRPDPEIQDCFVAQCDK